jgi:DNA-binding transcriptional LysR family regulator
LNDPDAGEVRVGSHELMSAALLPAVIDRLSRRYPRLVFTVSQAATIPALYDDLRERRVDFIFGRAAAASCDRMTPARTVWCMSPRHGGETPIFRE